MIDCKTNLVCPVCKEYMRIIEMGFPKRNMRDSDFVGKGLAPEGMDILSEESTKIEALCLLCNAKLSFTYKEEIVDIILTDGTLNFVENDKYIKDKEKVKLNIENRLRQEYKINRGLKI